MRVVLFELVVFSEVLSNRFSASQPLNPVPDVHNRECEADKWVLFPIIFRNAKEFVLELVRQVFVDGFTLLVYIERNGNVLVLVSTQMNNVKLIIRSFFPLHSLVDGFAAPAKRMAIDFDIIARLRYLDRIFPL